MQVLDNTPSIGQIEWQSVHISYMGNVYTIPNGYTSNIYVYWLYSSPNQFQASNTYPTLTDNDVLVFINKNGIHVTVPNSTIIDGSMIVPESILTNALAANCVTATQLAAGSVTANAVAANAIGANAIASNAITTNKIAIGAVTSSNINPTDYAGMNNDNVQVGGTNLIPRTSSDYKSVTFGGWDAYQSPRVPCVVGKIYTGRIYLKANVDQVSVNLEFRNSSTGAYNQHFSNTIAASSEGYATVTATCPAGYDTVTISIRHQSGSTPSDTTQYKEVKLETGNKATDWSPAPEDQTAYADNSASAAQTAAQNYADGQYGSTRSIVSANQAIWQLASNINSNGTFNTNKLNGTLSDSQIASSGTWNSATNLLNSWKSGSTLINGGLIATNTIFANSIAIGDFNNYCDNGDFENDISGQIAQYWNNLQALTNPSKTTGTGSYRNYSNMVATIPSQSSGNADRWMSTPLIPVTLEDYFAGSFDVKWESTSQAGNVALLLRGFDANGNGLSYWPAIVSTSVKEDWAHFEGNTSLSSAPANLAYVQIGVSWQGSAGSGGNIYIDNINVRRALTGNLIVDGAIDGQTINGATITSTNNGQTTTINGGVVDSTGTYTIPFYDPDDAFPNAYHDSDGNVYDTYKTAFHSENGTYRAELLQKVYPDGTTEGDGTNTVRSIYYDCKGISTQKGVFANTTNANYSRFIDFFASENMNGNTLGSGMEIYSSQNMDIISDNDLTLSGSNVYSMSNFSVLGAVTAHNMQLNGYHSLVMLDTQGLAVCGPAPSYTRVNVDAYSFTARNMQINGAHSLNSIDGGGLYASNGSGGTVDWTCKTLHQSSQFELKQDFADVDPKDSLNRIMNTDIESYRFKSDVTRGVNVPHIGAVIGGGYKLPSEYIDETGKAIILSDMTADLLNAFNADHRLIWDYISSLEEVNNNLLLKVSNLESRIIALNG